MDGLKPEIESSAIVALGSFNPAIFSPLWFRHFELLPPTEADAAQVAIVSSAVAQPPVDWLTVQVLQERCTLSVVAAHMRPALRDLALGTFRLLSHTPVAAVGFNHLAHFQLPSEQRWHDIGNRLVPKSFLGDEMKSPGTRVVVIEGQRDDGREGRVNLQIEPSLQLRHGLFLSLNDHFQIAADPNEVQGADGLIELVRDVWDESVDRSRRLMAATLAIR